MIKKKICSVFLALCLVFSFFVPCRVSAAESDFPEGLDNTFIAELDLVSDFYSNPSVIALGFTRNNSIFTINYLPQNYGYQLCAFLLDDLVYSNASFQSYNLPVVYSDSSVIYQSFLGLENLDSVTFSFANGSAGIAYVGFSSVKYQAGVISNNGSSITIPDYAANGPYLFYRGSFSFAPTPNNPLVGFPVGLNFSTEDFIQWIIDNDKISDLPGYIGSAKLASFISFYKDMGGSNTSFFSHIPQWFLRMNIVSQTAENKALLKQAIDKLYKEYVNSYAVTIYPSYSGLPHHRRNIQTVTTDDDLTLVTDLVDDTIDISILRDILRGVIQIPVALHNEMQYLFDKLDQMNFDVIVSNDGGQTDFSQLFLYSDEMYESDKQTFTENISQITAVPLSNIDTINNNSLMPENMLEDKQTLSVTFPMMNGFTMNADSTDYVITTDNFTFSTADYANFDETVQKIKRFASILLIIAYLIYLRFAIPHIIKGD